MTQPTQIVGNFQFLGVVDKPKAGVAYKVRNLLTNEFEVLRALPGATYGDPDSMKRFLREIRVQTRLAHPNIIAFHDALELEGQLVMTTEFVDGTTLAELLRLGPLPPYQAVLIVRDLLSGLEEAHSLGIVHRGITAEHAVISAEGGQVKLGGFGLAKPASDVNLTQAGTVLGDARYVSPEQVMGTSALDARADIYSVGVLLFQALTGRVPFNGKTDYDIMTAQVSDAPPRPSSLNPAVTPELEQVVLKALAKKPADRYQDARQFRTALEELKLPVEVPVLSSKPTPVPAAPRFTLQTGSGGAQRITLLIVLVGVAVALAIFFLVNMHRI